METIRPGARPMQDNLAYSRRPILCLLCLICCMRAGATLWAPETTAGQPLIVYSKVAPSSEALAAREVFRYVYASSGQLLELTTVTASAPPTGDLIVVAQKDRSFARAFLTDTALAATA